MKRHVERRVVFPRGGRNKLSRLVEHIEINAKVRQPIRQAKHPHTLGARAHGRSGQ
jgi:hypothetical protein